MLEAIARYDATPRATGIDDEIRRAALHDFAGQFTTSALAERFAEAGMSRVRRIIEQLQRDGRVRRVGKGRGTKWERTPDP
jgi:hypothetical protein